MASASASASISASASGTASASGNTLNEARDEATRLANTAAFYSLSPPVHPPADKHDCEKCLLTCIDFRFIDDAGFYMDINGDSNNYDQFILAGASLGYNGAIPNYENFTLFGEENIKLSHDLHEISVINIFDHLDCGAYRLVYTPEELMGDGEYNLHVENLNKAEAAILQKFPFIKKVNKYIINLDYVVIQIP